MTTDSPMPELASSRRGIVPVLAQQKLRKLYERIAVSPSTFYEEWRVCRNEHLPLSLDVLNDPSQPVCGPSGMPNDFKIQVLQPSVWISHQKYATSNDDAKTLILVVGFSEEQVVLSAALHVILFGCLRIVPVSSNAAWKTMDYGNVIEACWNTLRQNYERLKNLEWNVLAPALADGKRALIVEEDSPSSIFSSIRAWLKTNPHPMESVAIDATGGTKPMDSGASACAAYFNLPAYYIHATEYDPKLRRPLPHTTVYSLLDRPFTTFSFANRKSIKEAFDSENFTLALDLTEQLIQQIEPENGEFRDYFDREDRDNLSKLQGLLKRSLDWANARYERRYASPGSAIERPNSGNISNEAPVDRDIDDALCMMAEQIRLEKPNAGRQELIRRLRLQPKLFMKYIVNDYYRLRLLLGTQPSHDARATTARAENIREVVTVGYGMAESLLDSLLYLPVCRRRIHVHGTKPPNRIDQYDPSVVAKMREWGWIGPDPGFFHLASDQKLQLLSVGKAQFNDVRAATNGSRWLDDPSFPPNSLLPRQDVPDLSGKFSPSKRETDWLKNVFVRLWTPSSQNSSKPDFRLSPLLSSVAPDSWGEFLGIGQKYWKELRNDITHVRVPLDEKDSELAHRIIFEYLPRMIELYHRLSKIDVDEWGCERTSSTSLPISLPKEAEKDHWMTWIRDPAFSRESLVPWCQPGIDVESWLGLSLRKSST